MNIPSSSKTNSAVNALRCLALCKLAILLLFTLPILFRSFQANADLLAYHAATVSSFSLFGGLILMSLASVVISEVAARGLLRKKAWAWIVAVIIAVLNLPTLLFPAAAAVLWFLAPDAWREEALSLLKQEIGSKKDADT